MNLYFIFAIATTFMAPFIYSWVTVKPSWARFFDGLILTSLIGLVTLHILPESYLHGGTLTAMAVTIGLLGPLGISYLAKRKQCEIQKPFLFFTIIGFVAHNMLDGAALLTHPESHAQIHLLALAVVIHRFLESMALWRTFSQRMGKTVAIFALGAMCLAMGIGFFFAEQIVTRTHTDVLHVLQALAGGMLLHVLLHPHHVHEMSSQLEASRMRLPSKSIGALCGAVLALAIYLFLPSQGHSPGAHLGHNSAEMSVNSP